MAAVDLITHQGVELLDKLRSYVNACQQASISSDVPNNPLVLGTTKFTTTTRRAPRDLFVITTSWYISGDLVPDFTPQWWEQGLQVFLSVIGKHVEATEGYYRGKRVCIRHESKTNKHTFYFIVE